MVIKSIRKLGTLVFCACTGLLFFVSATQGLSCYQCAFRQDAAEGCQCRLNPSQDKKDCKEVEFNITDPRRFQNNHKKETQDQEPRQNKVLVCGLQLRIVFESVELFRYRRYENPENLEVNITSKCNLDQKLLTENNSLLCYCDTDWCNDQRFDFPNFSPVITTTTKLPCPTTTTTTTRKSTTTTSTAGTSTTTVAVPTTPCDPNPPTKPTTPQSVTSSAFNHRDDHFTMRKCWILCHTTILLIASLLPGSDMFKFK